MFRARVVAHVVAVVAGAALLWALRLDVHDRLITSDTLQYTYQGLLFLGIPDPQAHVQAVDWYCHARSLTGADACIALNSPFPPAQYSAIFAGRPGWLALAAPFLWAWGPSGMIALSLVGAVALGVAEYVATRELGGGFLAGLASVAAVFVSPAGAYASQVLPEGLAFALIAVVGTGADRVIRKRPHGTVVLALGLAGLYLVKSANAAACAIVLALLALLLVVRGRARWGRAARIAGASAVVSGAWFALSAAAGYAGLAATLEDLVTAHWTRLSSEDPWRVLYVKNQTLGIPYWIDLFKHPLWLVIGLIALYAVIRSTGSWMVGLAWLGLGLSGVALCLIHPIIDNWPRFLATYWVFVGVGAGCVVGLLIPETARRWKAARVRPS